MPANGYFCTYYTLPYIIYYTVLIKWRMTETPVRMNNRNVTVNIIYYGLHE